MTSEKFNRICAAWRYAGHDLEFLIESPYLIDTGRAQILCVASLPDFGGADGMIIQVLDSEIDHAIDPRVVEFGKAHNLFYAFLYPNSYEQYNKSRFREALEDWGYYGAEDRRPSWFTKNLQKR